MSRPPERWAGAFRDGPRFYLVHGEPGAQQALKEALSASDIEAEVPTYGETIPL